MKFLIAILALSIYCAASATSVYITRDGAGSKNGTTLGNAGACDSTPGTPQSTCAYFNNAGNWGVGATQIGAGTTVFVGGDSVTITATAGASGYMTFQAGGSSGNPIILYLQTTLSAPYWCCALSGGAIATGGYTFVTIDGGGTPCGWNTATNSKEGTCVGSITATANGDGLTFQNEYGAIYASSCSNVEVRNIGIYNMYVKSNVAAGGPSDSVTVWCASNSSNYSVHDNSIHDDETAIAFLPTSGTNSNWLVYNNDLYNMNWGIIVAAGGSSTISGFHITGNHIHDMANWDTNGGYHHDGIYPFGNANTNTLVDFEVLSNVFDGACQATGQPGCTSWLFMDQSDQCTSCYVANNVVLQTTQSSGASPGDPLFNLGINGGSMSIYNNTFVCSATNGNPGGFENDQHSGSTLSNAFNNLVVNCGRFVNITAHPNTHSPPTAGWDYNVYATASNGNMWSPPQGCCDATLSAWQGHLATFAASSDANAAYNSGSAGLGGSYENGTQSPISGLIPQTGSIAKGAGTNLTSLCGTLPSLCSDITGNARPSSGAWDAGALQSGSGSTYTITISSIVGDGTVTSSDSVINCTTGTTGTCTDSSATGTITLTETPAGGYSFTGWGGGTCSGSSSTCAVTGAATVTATFTANGNVVAPPVNLIIAQQAPKIELEWGASPTEGVDYDIWRSVSGGSFAVVKRGLQQLSWTDTNVERGTAYAYKSKAYLPPPCSKDCDSVFSDAVSGVCCQ